MADVRVAIVEDQPKLRAGLAALVGGTAGFHVVGAWDSMEAGLAEIDAAQPDVVLLDIGLPGMQGTEGARRLHERDPELPVVMLTVHADDARIFEALCAGARGYLLKDTPPERLVQALRDARAGGAPLSPEVARKVIAMFQRTAPPPAAEHHLSPRELDVLRVLSDGHSYKTAAAVLALSEDTIRFHVRNIYSKLHVHSKSEAVLKAFRSGLLG